MKTILVLAFDISPYRGSEAAVAWNFVTNMSHSCKLIVLTVGENEELNNWLHNNVLENVTFHQVPWSDAGSFSWLTSRFKVCSDIKISFLYRKWHKLAYNTALDIIRHQHVDVIHYLNPIGFKEPGYLWKIKDIPYVWGPLQGVENRPLALLPILSWGGKVKVLIRRIIHNSMFLYMPRFKKALKRADQLFAATPNTVNQLKNIHHKDSIYLPENGILSMERTSPIRCEGCLRLIWVGSIDERKALGLLILSLAKCQQKNWHLDVLGDGVLRTKCEQMAKKMGIYEKITFYGKVERTQVQRVFKRSHIHVITSLGESNTTVLWEAFSKAIPTLTLDHCGMAGVVSSECGIKIRIHSFAQVLNDIAQVIDDLILHPEKVESLSLGCIECAKKFMWNNRIDLFNHIYDKLSKNETIS